MQETELEDAPVVAGELGQDPLHGLSALLGRRVGRGGRQEVLAQLGLGQPEARAPEPAQGRTRRGEEVAADGAGRGVLTQPRDRFQSHLLRQVLGVSPVADPRVDECVHELQLVHRDIDRPRGSRQLDDFSLGLVGHLVLGHPRPR